MFKPGLVALLLAVAVLPVSAAPSSLANVDQTRELCGSAASSFAAGNTDAAFDLLKPYWPLPEEEMKNLSYQTTSQLGMVAGRFGAPIGSEHVSTKAAGSSFVQHVYIIKYEKHALRLTCRFYRPVESWIVNSITWDDQTEKLFH